MKRKITATLFALFVISQMLWSQNPSSQNNRYYGGFGAGIVLGNSNFKSIGANQTDIGYKVGAQLGYKINNYLSTEAELQYTNMSLSAYDCCQDLWLGADGHRYFAPIAGQNSFKYSGLSSKVNLYALGLHLNVDLLRLYYPLTKWSVLLTPSISAVASKASIKEESTNNTVMQGGNALHLGMGTDLGLGYQICSQLNIRLYSGITFLTGKSMDAMPSVDHSSNYVWNSGIKLNFSFGKRMKVAEVIKSETQVIPSQPEVKVNIEPKEPITQKEEVKVAEPIIVNSVVGETAIYFDFNKWQINERTQLDVLKSLLEVIAQNPKASITILGWADKVGSKRGNAIVASRRANNIQHFLIINGVDSKRISFRGMGTDSDKKVASEARRADIKLVNEK